MQRETVRIEKLRSNGIAQAAELLARSFETTPDYTHMFPDPYTRRDALRGIMRAPVRDSQAEGNCWVATDGTAMLGVAAWQAPGRYPWSMGRNLRALPALLSVLRHAPGSIRDLIEFGSTIDAHFPDTPLWYLQVIGVSPDPPERNRKFKEKEGLTFDLLSDEDHQLAESLGAWGEKKLYGKVSRGLIRSTFVVDETGQVDKAYRNVKATGHVDRVKQDLLGG